MGDVNREEGIKQLRKFLSYDEAIGKLHEAGVAEEFLKAIDKNPELLNAINKIAPDLGPSPDLLAGWSCCVTVDRPVRTPKRE